MSGSDFRTLHDELAAFDDVQWIDDRARQIVEQYMPTRSTSCRPGRRKRSTKR
jgi:hypothetical protein